MSSVPNMPENLVRFFRDACPRLPRLLATALVGSAARVYVQAPSDLDLLMVVDGSITGDRLAQELSHLVDHAEVASVGWQQYEDTLRTRVGNTVVSIAFLDIAEFTAQVRSTVEGRGGAPQYRPWTIGSYVPEVLLADIVDSVVLFDKTGELALLKDRLKTYPLQMKRVILASSSHELSVKARMLAQAGASDDSLWVSCIIGSLLQPLLRGLFARHGVYFRGMKHLTCQIVHHIPNELGLVRRLGTTNCQNLEETVAVLDSLSVELHRISIS